MGKRSVIEMLRTHILIDLHIVLIVRSCVLLKLCFVPLITLSQLYKCLFTIFEEDFKQIIDEFGSPYNI